MKVVPRGNNSASKVVPRRPAMLSRRALLLAAGAVPFSARAFGDASKFIPAIVKHGGRWDVRASGLRRLAWELQRRTSVEVQLEARPVSLDSPKLFEHPFLYLSSDGEFPPFTPTEVESLRRYLTFGGFLRIENRLASRASSRSPASSLGRNANNVELSPPPADRL